MLRHSVLAHHVSVCTQTITHSIWWQLQVYFRCTSLVSSRGLPLSLWCSGVHRCCFAWICDLLVFVALHVTNSIRHRGDKGCGSLGLSLLYTLYATSCLVEGRGQGAGCGGVVGGLETEQLANKSCVCCSNESHVTAPLTSVNSERRPTWGGLCRQILSLSLCLFPSLTQTPTEFTH